MKRTAIKDLKFEKGKLLNDFHRIGPIKESNYGLRTVPELLRLDSLLKTYNIYDIKEDIANFLAICNDYMPDTEKHIGNISNFKYIINKDKFISENMDSIKSLIIKPFGDTILLYPEMPMYYLIEGNYANDKLDKTSVLEGLKVSLERLYDGKSEYAILRRLPQLMAGIKSGGINISKHIAERKLELLGLYPTGLNEEEKEECHSFVYNVMNMCTNGFVDGIDERPDYFRKTNLSVSQCY